MKGKFAIGFVAALVATLFAGSSLLAQDCPATPGNHTVVWTLLMPSGNPPEELTSVEWLVKNESDGFAESCTLVDQNFTYNPDNGIFTINAPDICVECPDGEAFNIETGDILCVTVTGTETGSDPQTKSFEATIDLGQSPVQEEGDVTLPVELSTFEAVGGDGLVLVKWTTQSEINNMGFHIYRSTSETGEYGRITPEMIDGAGNSTQPIDYEFFDRNVVNGKTYYYKLEDVDLAGNRRLHGPVSATPDAGKVIEGAIPEEFELEQNAPNPFNPTTSILYHLPEDGFVTLDIYNLMGQKIRTLVNEQKSAGSYTAKWDGLDDAGRKVASGVYVYSIKAGSFSDVKKMLLLK